MDSLRVMINLTRASAEGTTFKRDTTANVACQLFHISWDHQGQLALKQIFSVSVKWSKSTMLNYKYCFPLMPEHIIYAICILLQHHICSKTYGMDLLKHLQNI